MAVNSSHLSPRIVIENTNEQGELLAQDYPLMTFKFAFNSTTNDTSLMICTYDILGQKQWTALSQPGNYYTKSQIDEMIGHMQSYNYKGETTFESLPTSGNKSNDVYCVTNDFTLGGKNYPAGSYVCWDGTEWTILENSLFGKEDKANKVKSLSEDSTDTQYPSAKAVYDYIESCLYNQHNLLYITKDNATTYFDCAGEELDPSSDLDWCPKDLDAFADYEGIVFSDDILSEVDSDVDYFYLDLIEFTGTDERYKSKVWTVKVYNESGKRLYAITHSDAADACIMSNNTYATFVSNTSSHEWENPDLYISPENIDKTAKYEVVDNKSEAIEHVITINHDNLSTYFVRSEDYATITMKEDALKKFLSDSYDVIISLSACQTSEEESTNITSVILPVLTDDTYDGKFICIKNNIITGDGTITITGGDSSISAVIANTTAKATFENGKWTFDYSMSSDSDYLENVVSTIDRPEDSTKYPSVQAVKDYVRKNTIGDTIYLTSNDDWTKYFTYFTNEEASYMPKEYMMYNSTEAKNITFVIFEAYYSENKTDVNNIYMHPDSINSNDICIRIINCSSTAFTFREPLCMSSATIPAANISYSTYTVSIKAVDIHPVFAEYGYYYLSSDSENTEAYTPGADEILYKNDCYVSKNIGDLQTYYYRPIAVLEGNDIENYTGDLTLTVKSKVGTTYYGLQYDITYDASKNTFTCNNAVGNLYARNNSDGLNYLDILATTYYFGEKYTVLLVGLSNGKTCIANKQVPNYYGDIIPDDEFYDNLEVTLSSSNMILKELPITISDLNYGYVSSKVISVYNDNSSWNGSSFAPSTSNKLVTRGGYEVLDIDNLPSGGGSADNAVLWKNSGVNVSEAFASTGMMQTVANFINIGTDGVSTPSCDLKLVILTTDSKGKKYGMEETYGVTMTSGWTLKSIKGNLYYPSSTASGFNGVMISSNYSLFTTGTAPIYVSTYSRPDTDNTYTYEVFANKQVKIADGTIVTDEAFYKNIRVYIIGDKTKIQSPYDGGAASASFGWYAYSPLTSGYIQANEDATWDGSEYDEKYLIDKNESLIKVDGLESIDNKVNSIDNTSSNDQYPTARSVYNEIEDKVSIIDGSIPLSNLKPNNINGSGPYNVIYIGDYTVMGSSPSPVSDYTLTILTTDSKGKKYGMQSHIVTTNGHNVTIESYKGNLAHASNQLSITSDASLFSKGKAPLYFLEYPSSSVIASRQLRLADETILNDEVAYENLKLYIDINYGLEQKQLYENTTSSIGWVLTSLTNAGNNSDSTWDGSDYTHTTEGITLVDNNDKVVANVVTEISDEPEAVEIPNSQAVIKYGEKEVLWADSLPAGGGVNIGDLPKGKMRTYLTLNDVKANDAKKITVTLLSTDSENKKYGMQYDVIFHIAGSTSSDGIEVVSSSIKGNLTCDVSDHGYYNFNMLSFTSNSTQINAGTLPVKIYMPADWDHLSSRTIQAADGTIITDETFYNNLKLYIDTDEDYTINDPFIEEDYSIDWYTSVDPTRDNNDLTWDGSDYDPSKSIFSKDANVLTKRNGDVLYDLDNTPGEKVTEIDDTATNDQYPSAKAVYDYDVNDAIWKNTKVQYSSVVHLDGLKGGDSSSQVLKAIGHFKKGSTSCVSAVKCSMDITLISYDSKGKRYGLQIHDLTIDPDQSFVFVKGSDFYVKGNLYYDSASDNGEGLSHVLYLTSNYSLFSEGSFPLYVGSYSAYYNWFYDRRIADCNGNRITDEAFYKNLKMYFKVDVEFDDTHAGEDISTTNWYNATISCGGTATDTTWDGSDFDTTEYYLHDEVTKRNGDSLNLESNTHKVSEITVENTDSAHYPSVKAVADYVKDASSENVLWNQRHVTEISLKAFIDYLASGSAGYVKIAELINIENNTPDCSFNLTILTTDSESKKYGMQVKVTVSESGWHFSDVKGNMYYGSDSGLSYLALTSKYSSFSENSAPIWLTLYYGYSNLGKKCMKLADGTTMLDQSFYDNMKLYIDTDGVSTRNVDKVNAPCSSSEASTGWYFNEIGNLTNNDATWDGSDYTISSNVNTFITKEDGTELSNISTTEHTSNKVTEINDKSDDIQYPTAKAVKDYVKSNTKEDVVLWGSKDVIEGVSLTPLIEAETKGMMMKVADLININSDYPSGDFTLTVLTTDSDGKKYGMQASITINGDNGWVFNSVKGNMYTPQSTDNGLSCLGLMSNYGDFVSGTAPLYLSLRENPADVVDCNIYDKDVILADGTTHMTDKAFFSNLKVYIDSDDNIIKFPDAEDPVSFNSMWCYKTAENTENSDTTWDGSDYVPAGGTNTILTKTDGDILTVVDTIEHTDNKVTKLADDATDDQYPTAKCVNDELYNNVSHADKKINVNISDLPTNSSSSSKFISKNIFYVDYKASSYPAVILLTVMTADSDGKKYAMQANITIGNTICQVHSVKGNLFYIDNDAHKTSLTLRLSSIGIGTYERYIPIELYEDSGHNEILDKSIILADGTTLTDSVAYDNLTVYIEALTGEIKGSTDTSLHARRLSETGSSCSIIESNSDATWDGSDYDISRSVLIRRDKTELLDLDTLETTVAGKSTVGFNEETYKLTIDGTEYSIVKGSVVSYDSTTGVLSINGTDYTITTPEMTQEEIEAICK